MKLKENQKETWRCAFMEAWRRHDDANAAAHMADAVVKQWEERSAFDDGKTGAVDVSALAARYRALAEEWRSFTREYSKSFGALDPAKTIDGLQRFVDVTGALHVRVPANLPPPDAANPIAAAASVVSVAKESTPALHSHAWIRVDIVDKKGPPSEWPGTGDAVRCDDGFMSRFGYIVGVSKIADDAAEYEIVISGGVARLGNSVALIRAPKNVLPIGTVISCAPTVDISPESIQNRRALADEIRRTRAELERVHGLMNNPPKIEFVNADTKES